MSAEPTPVHLLGVDTGGTFTDFFYPSANGIKILKVLSTPDDPGRAIREGIRQLGLNDQPCLLIHGTTVGTNAVLEGKGARVVYITNTGFGDLLRMGRQNRSEVYSLSPSQREIPIPKSDCLEVPCRLNPDGSWLKAPSELALIELNARLEALAAESVAINLIHGWASGAAEQCLADQCADTVFVAQSHQVLAEIGEYERGIATWLQASTGPVLKRYLQRLNKRLDSVSLKVMQSDGLTVSAEQAVERAVRLLLSGPAGGTAAAAYFAREYQIPNLLTFDMGGTSSDVALVGENLSLTTDGRIGPWPVAVPMVDIHTIGAGGGSIVNLDDAGLIHVGPESAGADPGPACYGKGGTKPCVTDAHVVLGRIPSELKLAGELPLDKTAAIQAIEKVAKQLQLSTEACAEGVIRLANEAMSRALRVVSADRGRNPADCALLSFGGAGGLHACELADLLGIQRVLIAPYAGVLSALGMTVAAPGRREVRSQLTLLDETDFSEIQGQLDSFKSENIHVLGQEGIAHDALKHRCYLGFRYQGQQASIKLPWRQSTREQWQIEFHRQHQIRYGYTLERAIELVDIEVTSEAKSNRIDLFRNPAETASQQGLATTEEVQVWSGRRFRNVSVYGRESLNTGSIKGPAIVTGQDTTIWIPEGWNGRQDQQGMLILEK